MKQEQINKILEEFDKWTKESDVNLVETLDIWEIRMIKEWIENMLAKIKGDE